MEHYSSSSETDVATEKPREAFSWLNYASDDGSGSFNGSLSSGSFGGSSGTLQTGRKRDTEIAFSQPFNLSSKRVSEPNPSKKRYIDESIPTITTETNLLPSSSANDEITHQIDLSNLFSGIRRERRGSLEHTVKYGVSSVLGRRKTNEDAYKAIPFSECQKEQLRILNNNNNCNSVNNNDTLDAASSSLSTDESTSSDSSTKPITQIEEKANYAFFAVYDGHGGTQAADFVSKHLHSRIVNHPLFITDTEEAIREGFRQTEAAFEELSTKDRIHGAVGTTACVGVIVNQTLYVANVGDSAAILCRRGDPVQLTTPHTPKNPDERSRIEACGGVISKDLRLGHPLWNPQYISLGVTRAIGDLYFKQAEWTDGKKSGLIAEPEIQKISLTTDDCFLLLASDGFWDVVSTQMAVNYILQDYSKDLIQICNKLIDLALTKATEDNTTVLLVKLKDLEATQTLPSPTEEEKPTADN